MTVATFHSFRKKNQEENLSTFLHDLDDAPDFHDPFSDLNLFLSREIKEHMRTCSCSKKWSAKIQEELLQKIAPKFQKKFPHLRLGISALRKSWDKTAYYLQQIQTQKEALTQDGKLNLSFFIKENLKQLPQSSSFHPSLFSHQLAMKMSECLAAVDGERPKLNYLTKLIWSLQRHLLTEINLQHSKSPYDDYDKVDKLIVKSIVEITSKEPGIGQHALEHQVKETLQSLQELPNFASLDAMTATSAALLAERMYPTSPFHTFFLPDQKEAITSFVRRQIALCQNSAPGIQHTDLVRRVLTLYALASQLPKNLSDEQLEQAIKSSYPQDAKPKPELPQSVFAFISAELVLAKTSHYCYSTDHVYQMIRSAYKEATQLPSGRMDILEIVIWKLLTENEGLLEKLPYRIGQRIEEEIAFHLIDNPNEPFGATVQKIALFFKQTKELTQSKKWSEIERKIHTWIIQGEMIYRWIRLDADKPLLRLIQEKALQGHHSSHQEFVYQLAQSYLNQHPELFPYTPQLQRRIWTLYKYSWYTLLAQPHESSFDRFLLWHAHCLHVSDEHLVLLLEETCKKILPLIPFDPVHCKKILNEQKAKDDQRKA